MLNQIIAIMRRIILLLLILSVPLIINGQTISGEIVDDSKAPIELAVVVVQTLDSIYVNSAYSDSLGEFVINADVTSFILTVQHLQYEPYQGTFSQQEVGRIELQEKEQQLSEVTVTGERPVVKVVDGRMTYNMPELLQNRMATNAYEAILELPGVSEQNNSITLAGANSVSIVVNGMATTMSSEQLIMVLKSMPKEILKFAEVTYSAPPQFHVRGAAINLVLDTGDPSEEPSLQGQINGQYNQQHYANYQGGLALIYNIPKSSTDFVYSFGYNRPYSGEFLTSNHLLEGTMHNIKQDNRENSRTPNHNIRLGNEWRMNEKNKINLTYTTQIQPWVDSYRTSDGTYSNSENSKKTDNPIQMHNIDFGYVAGFGLSAGVNYTYYKNHTTQNYKEKMVGKEDAFTANAKQNIDRVLFYADQNHQLGRGWGLTYGAKFSFASDKSSQIYHSQKGNDLSESNTDSKLNEYVYDLYGGFSKNFSEKLSLSASLTGEYYKHKESDYWSMFPNMEMTYVANPSNILQLSLSSDKAYPSYWEMQDAISYLNGYTEIHGNSNLKPVKYYSLHLNYIVKNKYIFTLFGNYLDDNFNQLPYQSQERLALIFQTLNFDYAAKLGFNVIIPFQIGGFIDSRFMLNGYYDKVKSSHFHDMSFKKDEFALYTSLDNTFNISSKPNIKAELSGAFTTPNIQGPMNISKMYKVDIGLKWTSNNERSELSIRVNDIFNSWQPKLIELREKSQDVSMRLINDTRSVSLSFSYKFGGYKESRRKEVDTSRFGSQ